MRSMSAFARLSATLVVVLLAAACETAETTTPSTTPDSASGSEVLTGSDAAAGSDSTAVDTGYNICTSGIANCDKDATCIPISETKYECKCNEGFEGSGKVCCGPGYKASPGGCSDIHECNDNVDDCDPNANCSNTTGSFTCKCKTGYEGDGKTCTAIGSDTSIGDADAGSDPDASDADAYNICNTAIANCDKNASCNPTSTTTYTCTCNEGFTGSGKVCCGPGYKASAGGCSDIHECNDNLDDCDQNANCSNTTGSFTCKCKTGYEGDGKTCTAIGADISIGDADAGSTPDSAVGTDTIVGTDSVTGTDATAGTDSVAGTDATAGTDASGSCPTGYYKAVDGSCLDIDECTTGTAKCSDKATCQNSDGSFTCTCNQGYNGDGKTCCSSGYTISNGTCQDIHECNEGLDDCDDNAACANNTGGFTCKCNSGYEGDGKSCTNIDECAKGTANCTANSTCQDSDGSFACVCNAGYKQSGSSCFDIDECLDQTDDCPAACLNTPGSFTCTSTVKDVNSPYYSKSCDPEFSFHRYSWKGTAPNETYEYQTNLIADCRCGANKQLAGGLHICQRPSDLPLQISFGTGPSVRKLPNASMLGGYFDTTTRKVYVGVEWQDSFYEDQGVIMAIDADTGNRSILSGQWVSDANGYETYGEADATEKTYWEDEIVGVGMYKNPLGRTHDIEMGNDGYLYAMTVDKDLYTVIVRVDIATGNRKIMWAEHRSLDPFGKNNPDHIQCSNGASSGATTVQLNQSAGFALEPVTGDYLLPVIQGGTSTNITPNGVVRIKKDGTGCDWVTRFGMGSANGFAGQTKGTGPLAQFSFDAMYMHEGKLLAVELDTNQDIFQIDLDTGKRTVLGEGVSTDWLAWDAKRGLMWGGGTGAGTAVNSWNMTSGIVFQHLGMLLAKPVDFQRVTGPLATCCGTHAPGWIDPLNDQLILIHNSFALVRMEPESGNSVTLSL
jgi:hypothetical protein